MTTPLDRQTRIYVSGHRGLVGNALVECLRAAGFQHILTATREQVDLRDQAAVHTWFAENQPQMVIHAAGTVGGIHANATRPAEFMYDNLMIHATVLRAAWEHEVEKLLYLGSSCIYPRNCPQPMREDYLLSGPLEKTNEAYALAKITGLKSCEFYRDQYGCNFISAMPTNLYGPGDNFNLSGSHVLPALLRKFHDARMAKQAAVTVWGTGQPKREFLYVADLAAACLFLLENYDQPDTINVGTGQDVTIGELANEIRQIVYPEAQLTFDSSKPDGTPRKLLEVNRINQLGWRHATELRTGIEYTYQWFLENQKQFRA